MSAVPVAALDAAADREADEARSVLADLVAGKVRFPAAALVACMDGGEGDDPEMVRHLIGGRSYTEIVAMLLLVADCADKAAVTKACGINPGLALSDSRRILEARYRAEEYAHLRDGGVSPEAAGARLEVQGRTVGRYEDAYQAQRAQREEGRAA